jgi:hypothetical protein
MKMFVPESLWSAINTPCASSASPAESSAHSDGNTHRARHEHTHSTSSDSDHDPDTDMIGSDSDSDSDNGDDDPELIFTVGGDEHQLADLLAAELCEQSDGGSSSTLESAPTSSTTPMDRAALRAQPEPVASASRIASQPHTSTSHPQHTPVPTTAAAALPRCDRPEVRNHVPSTAAAWTVEDLLAFASTQSLSIPHPVHAGSRIWFMQCSTHLCKSSAVALMSVTSCAIPLTFHKFH